jgi:hypothetical protein
MEELWVTSKLAASCLTCSNLSQGFPVPSNLWKKRKKEDKATKQGEETKKKKGP